MMKLVVLCCVLAAAAARAPAYFSPVSIPSPPSTGNAAPLQEAFYNYRGPLSLAPGQPANILATDGRPLDTLSVNLDRSAHFIAKALENGSRVLKKRSVTRLAVAPGLDGFGAAVAAGNVGISTPIFVGPNGITANIAANPISRLSAPVAAGSFGVTSPFVVSPFGLSTPIVTGSILGSEPFGARPFGISAPITAGTLSTSTPVSAGSIALAPVGAGSLAVAVPVTDSSNAQSAPTTVRPIGLSASGNPFVRII